MESEPPSSSSSSRVVIIIIKNARARYTYVWLTAGRENPSRHLLSVHFRTDWPLSLSRALAFLGTFQSLGAMRYSSPQILHHHRQLYLFYTHIYSILSLSLGALCVCAFINSLYNTTVHAAIFFLFVFTQSRQVQRTGENQQSQRLRR